MRIGRRTGAVDLGEFYQMALDPELGKVELRVRRLPTAIALRLQKQKVKIRGNVTTVSVPEEQRRQREEAFHCWTGSRNLTVTAFDAPAAVVYAKLCPGVEFPVDQAVNVDGCLTDELKRDILTEFPEVCEFIRRKAKALQVADDEEEEEAQGN